MATSRFDSERRRREDHDGDWVARCGQSVRRVVEYPLNVPQGRLNRCLALSRTVRRDRSGQRRLRSRALDGRRQYCGYRPGTACDLSCRSRCALPISGAHAGSAQRQGSRQTHPMGLRMRVARPKPCASRWRGGLGHLGLRVLAARSPAPTGRLRVACRGTTHNAALRAAD